jgi:molybdopterin-guanine dinucleotide biosynthesis protein A
VIIAAVVLAGGRSTRFGSDKLAAEIDGVPLLHRAVAPLPADWQIIVVGPDRDLGNRTRALTVREDPPGGGPAAALVAGATAALAAGADTIVTLPGDAPGGGQAAIELVEGLRQYGDDAAVVGTDADGVPQPLQLAATGDPLRRLAGRTDAAGASARSLLAELGDYTLLPLPRALTGDVDTPEDIERVLNWSGPRR